VVLHGMKSEEYAKGIASILKEFKEYKVSDTPIIISAQNYEIVQMKKNLSDYLNNPVLNVISVTDQIPFIAPAPTQTIDPNQVQVTPAALQSKAQSQNPPAGQSAQQKTGQSKATPTRTTQSAPKTPTQVSPKVQNAGPPTELNPKK